MPQGLEERRTRSDRIRRLGVKRRVLGDLYHFLLTTSWPRLMGSIVVAYFALNAAFALLYWLDRDAIENAESLGDCFFFSVQTIATIGYGKMTPRSTLANVIVSFESIIGLLGFAMASGLMFAKFSRPNARVSFSKNAVVSRRDGKLSLMVRVANERTTGLVEANVRLILLRDEKTAEGEYVRRFHPLKLVRPDTPVFALTLTVTHVIDEASPLAGETAESLAASDAELSAAVVGLDSVTGETVHARYTWLAREMLWGKRFADILTHEPDGTILIDQRRFHDVEDA